MTVPENGGAPARKAAHRPLVRGGANLGIPAVSYWQKRVRQVSFRFLGARAPAALLQRRPAAARITFLARFQGDSGVGAEMPEIRVQIAPRRQHAHTGGIADRE